MSSFSHRLLQYLSVFDLFKTEIFLNFENKEKTSTILGKLISILIAGLMLYTFISSDLIQKKSPNVVNQEIEAKKRPFISLNSSSFTMVFALSDDNNWNYPIDKSIWDIKPIFKYYKVDGSNYTLDKRSYHRCRESDFPRNPEIYSQFNLYNYTYCLDNKNINVSGYWDEEEVSYFVLEVHKCINTTENNNSCKSLEEIEKFFVGKYFGVYLEKVNINVRDYKNPFTSMVKYYYRLIEVGIAKVMYLYLEKVSIETNDGFFTDSNNLLESYKFGNFIYDYAQKREDMLFAFFIYSDAKIEEINRYYIKFGDIIGKMGGIASIIMIFGALLAKLEASLYIKNNIINEIYAFPKKINQSKLKKVVTNAKEKDLNPKKIDPNIKPEDIEMSVKSKRDIQRSDTVNFNKYKEEKKTSHRILMGFFDYIKFKLKPKNKLNEKEKLYKKGENNMKKDMNIVEIIRKLHDIDKIKAIIFDESQLHLFELVSKPMILQDSNTLKKRKTRNFFDVINRNQIINSENLINHFKKVSEKAEKTEIDERLLGMLDRGIEKFIKINQESLSPTLVVENNKK